MEDMKSKKTKKKPKGNEDNKSSRSTTVLPSSKAAQDQIQNKEMQVQLMLHTGMYLEDTVFTHNRNNTLLGGKYV